MTRSPECLWSLNEKEREAKLSRRESRFGEIWCGKRRSHFSTLIPLTVNLLTVSAYLIKRHNSVFIALAGSREVGLYLRIFVR